jgi:hypothetical protein
MPKRTSNPKNAPRVTVELETIEFRNKAQRAVRRLGYMTLSDYLREKMDEAIRQVEKPAARGASAGA